MLCGQYLVIAMHSFQELLKYSHIESSMVYMVAIDPDFRYHWHWYCLIELRLLKKDGDVCCDDRNRSDPVMSCARRTYKKVGFWTVY